MPERQLPSRPSLAHLKHQARDLLDSHRAGEAGSVERIAKFPVSKRPVFRLSDAQFVIAREYGFESWSRLRVYVETVAGYACSPHKEAVHPESPADAFLRLACLAYGKNESPVRREQARQMLDQQPGIRGANLHVAAATGDFGTAASLLETNPQFARVRGGPNHWEPLLYLAYSRVGAESANWLETARLLLRHGGDPNAAYLWEGNYLFTVLTGVFGEGESGPVNLPEHPEWLALAELFLGAGANPNDAQVLYNRQFVPGSRHLQILLKYGLGKPADDAWSWRLSGRHVQAPAQLLEGQLILAAAQGHADRVELLLDHGVDPNPLNRQGRTPYELALLAGHAGIAARLLSRGARRIDLSPPDAFAAACAGADRVVALALLHADASLVSQLASRQAEMLATAASGNHLEAMRLMADVGFDLNAMRHSTPLHEAAWNGHLEMVKLLVDRGANPALRDRSHHALPADWAAYNQRPEVAAYLQTLQPPNQS